MKCSWQSKELFGKKVSMMTQGNYYEKLNQIMWQHSVESANLIMDKELDGPREQTIYAISMHALINVLLLWLKAIDYSEVQIVRSFFLHWLSNALREAGPDEDPTQFDKDILAECTNLYEHYLSIYSLAAGAYSGEFNPEALIVSLVGIHLSFQTRGNRKVLLNLCMKLRLQCMQDVVNLIAYGV